MSIVPIRGKFHSVPTLLAHLAEDDTVTEIIVCTFHGPSGPDRRMRTVSTTVSRESLAFAGVALMSESMEPNED